MLISIFLHYVPENNRKLTLKLQFTIYNLCKCHLE